MSSLVRHLALGVEYDGSCFHGWQHQSGPRSVQQTLEGALSRIADEPIRLIAAGRTDAGVHATQQVVRLSTAALRSDDAWLRGTNSLLPPEVRVGWVRTVPGHFHPRFSATGRRYVYLVVDSGRSPAIGRQCVVWSPRRLDDAAMHVSALHLVGEHDFTSFRSAACQSKSPYRCIFTISVRRFDDIVAIDVTANAFLHHMVRNIVGALLQVGRGAHDATWLRDVLVARDRRLIGATAPPNGLYLVNVNYGAEFEFPEGRLPLMLRAAGDVW